MRKYYIYDELKRKSHYDLYKICVDEKLVEGFRENLNRTELINIILKYRSREKVYCIDSYKEFGMERLQELFDTKLGFRLNDSNSIKIPHKIVIYKGMSLTEEDDYRVTIPEHISENNIFLLNGNNYLCGVFQLIRDRKGGNNSFFIKSDERLLRLDNLKNQNYSLLFFCKSDEKFLFSSYYADKESKLPLSLNYYQVPLDSFQFLELEVTDTPLCIDFGTANTTAGAYLDKYYVKNLPQHKILSEHIYLDKTNYVKFPKGLDEYSNVIPTVVYIKNCFNEENIEYAFGYEVEELLKENNYNLKGSVFYGIKNWVKSIREKERIVDENGDIRYVERKKIVKAYIDYIVYRAETLFKCKFKNIHITTPVKLKSEFIMMFKEILPDYTIIEENALDEGVAVLYNSIENIIYKNKFVDGEEYKALIIDCGGGTTDLASCVFKINSEEINYDIDIKTTFENSEESFGGNNITYRVMQYLKIILAQHYQNKKDIGINELIPNISELIYRDIDEKGVKEIYKNVEIEYEKADRIIPTKFADFENKASDMYSKVKNNFFFMWEIAEALKKELFRKTTIVRTKFDSVSFENSDLSTTVLPSWNLNINDNGFMRNINTFPNIIINKSEIIKLIKGDIYEIFRRFLTLYYETGIIFDYSLIKLSGQTCKVNLFEEVLKEFVPGKMVDFRRNLEEDEQQLKISCLDGAIRYLNSSKIGDIRVTVENDIPIVPYSLHGTKYTGEEIEVLRTGEQAGSSVGTIKKISSTEILPLYLKNKEEEIKKHFTYINKPEFYIEKDEQDILKELDNRFEQDDLDTIYNGETKFFIYTDKNYWGFYVTAVKRDNDQTFVGKKQYFSFEEDITTISFFDGRH